MYCEKLMHLGEFLVAHEVSFIDERETENEIVLFEEI